MHPTDTGNPDYYHRVVDCQWACPAHTDVPEYIRLIAQGKYTESYLLNRESNVFPGILGRVCDRPCEPACRRRRIEEKPVAICRLKRVAADFRGKIQDRLSAIPSEKNGKRIALIGAGPASLTVANDLMPLGYEIAMFEKLGVTGGLMRTNIPAFRLPTEILDEEIDMIIDMGVDLRLNTPIESLRALLEENYDAVFVGTGAPHGKNLEIPGRYDTDQIYVGIAWLESVAFGHINSIAPRVVIIGGGNTAMDCCRTAKRIGGKDIKVVARKPYLFLKASDWELEEAEEITANYDAGTTQSVTLHDGSRLNLKKIDEAYDPTDPVKTHSYIHEHQLKGEIVTGLLYINEEGNDMHDLAGTSDVPLVDIPYEKLNPGKEVLREFQDSLR